MMRDRFLKKTKTALLCMCICTIIATSACEKDSYEPDYSSYNTYAFFGVDSRASDDLWKTDEDETGTAGKPSSDVIMLVRIDEESDDVKVVSIYRDTMLDISEDATELDKCNAAYRNNGAYGAIYMLERNLDIRISGYITANFKAVADAIDALGGIEIDVEDVPTLENHRDAGENSIEVINHIIDEMNEVYDADTPHLTYGGLQIVNGIQAVAYSRLRYTEGSDLRRAQRQRTVLAKMFEKLNTTDASTQRSVLKDMYSSIDTDLDEAEMMSMLDLLSNVDINSMEGFPYYKKAVFGEKAYFVPCDLKTNVTEFHKRMYGEEDYQPGEDVKIISNKIEEQTGIGADDADDNISDAY